MKGTLFLILFLLCLAFSAQAQITVNAHTVEVTGTARNNIYPAQDVYFVYASATGAVDVYEVDTRELIWRGLIGSVTITGLSTAADKIAYIERTHIKVHSRGFSSYFPKSEISFRYRSSDKKIDIFPRFYTKKGQIWNGHIDSIKTASSDTTTALRLASLRRIIRNTNSENIHLRNASPTIAAGAAAGTSPTIAITPNVGGKRFQVTVTPGATPATGVLATVTLPVTFPTGCLPMLSPVDTTTAPVAARISATGTTNTVVISVATTALTQGTVYKWNVDVEGY